MFGGAITWIAANRLSLNYLGPAKTCRRLDSLGRKRRLVAFDDTIDTIDTGERTPSGHTRLDQSSGATTAHLFRLNRFCRIVKYGTTTEPH